MKERVLGKNYDCSLVIVDDTESKRLNEQYRKKTYTPNVLSFPLDGKTGEIFLNMKQARREYKDREMTLTRWTALLVIHALLHLKGMSHGSTMEKVEARLLGEFVDHPSSPR
jgi:probable rRNA maturation factor